MIREAVYLISNDLASLSLLHYVGHFRLYGVIDRSTCQSSTPEAPELGLTPDASRPTANVKSLH